MDLRLDASSDGIFMIGKHELDVWEWESVDVVVEVDSRMLFEFDAAALMYDGEILTPEKMICTKNISLINFENFCDRL